MTQEKKTHFRTFSNSKHLASEDLLGLDYLSVTIDSVKVGRDLNRRKQGDVPIAYFREKFIRPNEPLKTMILNITNMKSLEDITGSPYLEDWKGVPVEIFVDSNVRFGNEVVDGLRIRKINPDSEMIIKRRAELIEIAEREALKGKVGLEAFWRGLSDSDKKIIGTEELRRIVSTIKAEELQDE